MIYQAVSQQTCLIPVSPNTYGPSYHSAGQWSPVSLTSRALSSRGHRPHTTTQRSPLIPVGYRGEALIPAEHWPCSTPRGKPSPPRTPAPHHTRGRESPQPLEKEAPVEAPSPGVLGTPGAVLTHPRAPPAA